MFEGKRGLPFLKQKAKALKIDGWFRYVQMKCPVEMVPFLRTCQFSGVYV